MRKIFALFNKAWVLALIAAIAFGILVDRRPMAINVYNQLQHIPQFLLDTVTHKRPLDEREAWDAVQYYEDRLLLSPNDTGAMTSLGYIFTELKVYPKALLMYQNAFKIDPDLFGLRYNLAYVYYQMGHIQASYEVLSESLKHSPVLRNDCVSFLGVQPLDGNKIRRIMQKVSMIVAYGQKVPANDLCRLFNGFFDDGFFYYAFLKSYTANGKMQIVLF